MLDTFREMDEHSKQIYEEIRIVHQLRVEMEHRYREMERWRWR